MNAGERALGLLVANRLVVYVGGLLVIASLPLASRTGVSVPPAVRTALFVVVLGLMVATYIGERIVAGSGEEISTAGDRTAAGGDGQVSYSWRTRFAVLMTVAGVAVGVYVLVEVDFVLGLLFVGGALLFARVAFGGGEVKT